MKISQDVMTVLDQADVDGNRLVLVGQLDRKLYADVNKVLEAIGGKWSRGAKAHLFDMPVVDVLSPIMETGEYSRTKQDFGQFDTPPDVAARVMALADLKSGMMVLEPSAGIGNIALAAAALGAEVTCYEVDERRCDALVKASGASAHRLDMVIQRDFLTVTPAPVYELVLMNPPFAGQVDIDHVLHAAKFLREGGRLVAIMSAGVMFRGNAKAVKFREYVSGLGGSIEKLPDGSFSASGTQVHTCIVTVEMPA